MADNGLARRKIDNDNDAAEFIYANGDETKIWCEVGSTAATWDFATSLEASNSNFYKLIDALHRYSDGQIMYYAVPQNEGTYDKVLVLMKTAITLTALQTWLRAEVDSNITVSSQFLYGNFWD